MFREKKYCKTVIAILLVLCFTFANCFTLFTNISLATEESLGKQASESINDNVEYDAKLAKNDDTNGYELEGTINEENLSINMQVEIKKEGYLKNAKILIESENGLSFEFAEEKNEKYQIEENQISLSNISAGEKLDIKIPIKYKQRDDIENLNKKINVKLIGTYVKNNGKESGISQNVVLKLIWHTNTEYTITSELRKYIPYNKGIILQTSVTSLLPEQNNYVEKEELQIDAVNLDGYKIEKIIVSNKSEEDLKETEWDYNKEENKINIKIQNNKEAKESQVKELEEVKIKLQEEVKLIKEKLLEQMDLLKEKEKLDHKLALLNDLDKLFKGKKFVEFVAATRLKYVSLEASRKLKEVTNGNYGLEVDEDGKFIIRDYKNGGAGRDASTLSGGETFLASLALSLALSAEIQLKGTAPLELFFLDEGFGTLDDNLLEVVMSSLERIHNDKLKVGIISHVESIKNRVPVKLLVTPAQAGMGGSKVKIERS